MTRGDPAGVWPRPDLEPGLGPMPAAAGMALVVHPGPVGELLHREIHAYLEIGLHFGGDALIHRLVAHLNPRPKEPTDG